MPLKDPEARRAYNREYQKKWRKENKHKHNHYVNRNKREYWQRYHDYKATLQCSKCGFSHPAALDFHHRDPALKEDSILQMVQNNRAWSAVLAEIAKCDVLCANCHRIHHYDERRQSPTDV